MSVEHKKHSVAEGKDVLDRKTLTKSVTTLGMESEITNEALIETWLANMEATEALMELANMVLVLNDKVNELEQQIAKGGE